MLKKKDKTKKRIDEVNNYDLKDFEKFYSERCRSEDISRYNNNLAFNRTALDTMAKQFIKSDFIAQERDIYEEAYREEFNQSKTKDTIISIHQEINVNLNSIISEKDNEIKVLKKSNKPKIKQIAIAAGIGLISGFLLSN